MTNRKNRTNNLDKVDVDDLLAKRQQVAVIWGTDDVQSVRPDLDDDQSWQVLKRCLKVHDCNYGFTWDLIEMIADEMHPAPDVRGEE